MNEAERKALVGDVVAILQRVKYVKLGASLEPIAEEIIDTVLADRTVPEPDAAVGDAPIVPDPRRIDTGYDLPNGERIHEGDVLECHCEGRQLVKWEPLMSSWIVWGMDEFIYFDEDGNDKTFPFEQVAELKEYISWHGKLSTFSRIGNVYDNPELIESVEMPRKRSAAGDDLDALLDSVHPESAVTAWLESRPEPESGIMAPHFMAKIETHGKNVFWGDGTTRMLAIKNAVAQATTTQEGTRNE